MLNYDIPISEHQGSRPLIATLYGRDGCIQIVKGDVACIRKAVRTWRMNKAYRYPRYANLNELFMRQRARHAMSAW